MLRSSRKILQMLRVQRTPTITTWIWAFNLRRWRGLISPFVAGDQNSVWPRGALGPVGQQDAPRLAMSGSIPTPGVSSLSTVGWPLIRPSLSINTMGHQQAMSRLIVLGFTSLMRAYWQPGGP